jgi:uncharacterized membrane protein YagU involved in acid resistance
VNWPAAVYAGLAAGFLATAAEIVLWALFTDALPATFLRDARFAAAIALGRKALTSTATVDWDVWVVATLVHLALSLAYASMLSLLIRRLPLYSCLLAGAAFGLVLYAINMYGFTTLFPWFEATRDWITATAHVVFGIVAAGVYAMLAGRRAGSGATAGS